MKVWVSHYTLGVRKGFLLKLQNEDFAEGYGDCHPWTSLGDESVDFQIKALQNGIKTELLERSFYFAEIDGKARTKNQSLLKGLPKVKNHKTLMSARELNVDFLKHTFSIGFKKIKIKISPKFQDDFKKIFSFEEINHFKLRLDFNGKFGDDALDLLKVQYPEVLKSNLIEWIEDPVPYKAMDWKKLFETYQVPLAYDHPRQCRIPEDPFCQYRIIKPAKLETPNSKIPTIFTHYLDHEIGRRQSYWQALKDARGPQTLEWGFLPENWTSGPEFGFEDTDIGFGMTDFLQNQNWSQVI